MQRQRILWMTSEAGLDSRAESSWSAACLTSSNYDGTFTDWKVQAWVKMKRYNSKSKLSIYIPASISSGVFFFFGFGFSTSASPAGSSDISTSLWSTCLPSSNPCVRPTWTSSSASSRAQTTTQHRVKLSQMISTSALMPPNVEHWASWRRLDVSLNLAAEVAIIQHLTCRCTDSAVWSCSDTLMGSQ